MNKVDVLYDEVKKEIYSYYLGYSGITSDNISEVNDIIIDKLNKSYLENDLIEFYVTVSMCCFMIENDLYDEYFFKSYIEILDDYKSGKFDNLFKDIISDKALIESDIEDISEYLKKDEIKSKYYSDVSDIYNSEFKKFEEEIDNYE